MTAATTTNAPASLNADTGRASWSDIAVARYTWWLAGLTLLAAIALLVLGPPNAMSSAIIMVVAVGLIGIPHGAYDLAVGRTLLLPRLGRSWAPTFLVVYVVLALVAALLWIVEPWIGLSLLLVAGAAHWGVDDLELVCSPARRLWLGTSRGALPVALPLTLHPGDTARIFEILTATSTVNATRVQLLGTGALVLAAPGLAWQLLSVRDTSTSRWRARVEVGVLVSWFVAAPPVLAFTVYFCVWHSVRHALRSIGRIDAERPARAAATYVAWVIGPTIATWVGAAAVWVTLSGPDSLAPSHIAWQIVFVGLFALTVPHLVLEIAAARRAE